MLSDVENMQIRDDFNVGVLEWLLNTSIAQKISCIWLEIIPRQITNPSIIIENRQFLVIAWTMLGALFNKIETINHLFASCPKTRIIWFSNEWEKLRSWNGWNFCKWKNDKVTHLIWLTSLVCIWLELNDILFNRKVANIAEMLDKAMWLSWSLNLFFKFAD